MTSKGKVIAGIIAVGLTVVVALFVYKYSEHIKKVVSPFFIAIIIAYMVNPLVNKLHKKRISKPVSILIVYALIVLILVSIMLFLVPELIRNTRELISTLPELTGRCQNMINRFMNVIRSSDWPVDIKNTIFKEIENGIDIAEAYAVGVLKKALGSFINVVKAMFDIVLAMIIAYYFIKDANFFKNAALSLVPRKWRNGIINTGRDIHGILTNFIQGQVLVAIIVGALETVGLLVIKVKYPLILGLVGGVLNIIPYFGPIIGAVPSVAMALIDSPVKALWAAAVFTLIQQLDNTFISPKIIEGKLGLHPVTTILAVLVGGEFFGIVGMLIGVPVAAMLKAILKRVVDAIV